VPAILRIRLGCQPTRFWACKAPLVGVGEGSTSIRRWVDRLKPVAQRRHEGIASSVPVLERSLRGAWGQGGGLPVGLFGVRCLFRALRGGGVHPPDPVDLHRVLATLEVLEA
jgi:hypothetical protein